jgi:hypothetical protein
MMAWGTGIDETKESLVTTRLEFQRSCMQVAVSRNPVDRECNALAYKTRKAKGDLDFYITPEGSCFCLERKEWRERF